MPSPYTLSRLIEDVGKRLVDETGGTVGTDIVTSYANEALRALRRAFDLPSQKFISQLVAYNGIEKYPLPDGFKEFSNLTFQEELGDPISVRYVKEPDFWRAYPIHQVIVSDGRNGTNRSLLLNLNDTLNLSNQLIHECESFDGNGTWVADTAGSDAANVRTTTLYRRTGSVAFDIIVGQSVNHYADIAVNGFNSVNLSAPVVAGVGTATLELTLPSAVDYTSFTMRFGSSPTDYYEVTVTTQLSGEAFVQGKNVLGFDWSTATTVGSPVDTAIDYLFVRATYPSTFTSQVGVCLNNIMMRQKVFLNLHFISDNALIDGSSGTPKDQFTSDTDTSSYLNIDSSFVDWILYTVMEDIYLNVNIYPSGQASYKEKRMRCEDDIYRRFPSDKPPIMTNYMESDDIQEQMY